MDRSSAVRVISERKRTRGGPGRDWIVSTQPGNGESAVQRDQVQMMKGHAGGDRSGRRRSRAARQMGCGGREGGMAGPCGAAQDGGGLRNAFDPGPAFVSYGPYEMTAEGLHIEVEKGRGDEQDKGERMGCCAV